MDVIRLHEGFAAALAELSPGSSPVAMAEAAVRGACQHLGADWAAVWVQEREDPRRLVACYPQPGAVPSAPGGGAPEPGGVAWAGSDCRYEVASGGGTDPALTRLFAAAAARLLAEAHLRARAEERAQALAREAARTAERHRQLARELEALGQELDAAQRQQLVLGERNRIARDLHDRTAQTLFLIGLKVDWLLARLPADWPHLPELERLRELAAQGLTQTREAIFALRAGELDSEGLPGALGRLVRQTQACGIDARLTVSGRPAPLGAPAEDALLKVAQEALTNVTRHSRATVALVSLRYEPGHVTLVVQDNGVGMAPEALDAALADPSHLGLRSMRQRTRAVGGELTVEAGDDGGLVVRAVVPTGGEDRAGAHPDRG